MLDLGRGHNPITPPTVGFADTSPQGEDLGRTASSPFGISRKEG
jgi:hypothetical protein